MDLISNPMGGPLFKTDICGNLLWTESSFWYHHSLEQDSDGIIWFPGTMALFRRKGKILQGISWVDDAIIGLTQNGEVVAKESVAELLFRKQGDR